MKTNRILQRKNDKIADYNRELKELHEFKEKMLRMDEQQQTTYIDARENGGRKSKWRNWR